MKKFITGCAVLLMGSAALMASDYKMFVGFEVGNSEGEFSTPTFDYTTDNDLTYGFKIGGVGEDSRIYFTYDHINAFENSDTKDGQFQTFAVAADGMTRLYHLTGDLSSRFFVGGHIGGINVELDSDMGSTNTTDLLYGIQGGMQVVFPKNAALEVGYKIAKSTFSSLDHDLDRLDTFYAGLNWTF